MEEDKKYRQLDNAKQIHSFNSDFRQYLSIARPWKKTEVTEIEENTIQVSFETDNIRRLLGIL